MPGDIISLGVELDPRRLSAGVRESQRQLRRLDAQARRNGMAFQQLSKETGKSVPELRNMAAASLRSERNLQRMARQTGLSVGQLQALKTQAATSTTSLAALGGQLRMLAGPLGFVGVGVAAVSAIKSLAQFETRMAEIATIASGGRRQVEFLRNEILELSRVVPKTADDLGAGAYQILSAGFTDAADASDILKASANAAVAGLTSVESAVDAVTTVLNAYQKPATEAARVSDILFETVKLGKLKFEDIATNIGEAATAAALMGISVEELTAGMATMTLHGINAAESVTALNRLFLTLVDKQGDAAKKFEDMGIAFDTAAVAQKGFAGVMADLNKLTDGQVEELAELFPELRAAKGAFIIAGAGAKTYQGILEQLINTMDSAAKGAATMTGTAESQWQIIKNDLNVELQKLGTVILPVVTAAMKELGREIKLIISPFALVAKVIKEEIVDAWAAFDETIGKEFDFKSVDTLQTRIRQTGDEIERLQAIIAAGTVTTPFGDKLTADAIEAKGAIGELRDELALLDADLAKRREFALRPELPPPMAPPKPPPTEAERIKAEQEALKAAYKAAQAKYPAPPAIAAELTFDERLTAIGGDLARETARVADQAGLLADAIKDARTELEKIKTPDTIYVDEYRPEIKPRGAIAPTTEPMAVEAPPGFLGPADEDIRNFYGGMRDGLTDMAGFWQTGFRGMSMILSDFITGGIEGFEDLGDAILRMFQRLALEKAFETVGTAIGLKFQTGGPVPGPEGKPQIAVVHGGEYVIPVHERKRQERDQFTFSAPRLPNIAVDYGQPPELQAPALDRLSVDYGKPPNIKAPQFDKLAVEYGQPPAIEAPAFEQLFVKYGEPPQLKVPQFDKLNVEYGQVPELVIPQFDALSVDYGKPPKIELGDMPEVKFGKPPKLDIPGYQTGGIVPGPIGQPQLAVVHGGEQVVPVRDRRNENVTVSQNINFNISALDAPSVQQLLTQQKGTITAVVAEAINDSDTIRRLITRR